MSRCDKFGKTTLACSSVSHDEKTFRTPIGPLNKILGFPIKDDLRYSEPRRVDVGGVSIEEEANSQTI